MGDVSSVKSVRVLVIPHAYTRKYMCLHIECDRFRLIPTSSESRHRHGIEIQKLSK